MIMYYIYMYYKQKIIHQMPGISFNSQYRQTNLHIDIAGKFIFTVVLLFVSFHYLQAALPWTVIDGADLLFHEAGHFLWAFAGQFIGILGGSLTQALIPISLGVYFFARKSWYSMLFCMYWLGINLINVGIYIGDAQSMSLPLINEGSIHDWNYLLTRTRLLPLTEIFGNTVRGLGSISMLIALAAMGFHIFTLFSQPEKK